MSYAWGLAARNLLRNRRRNLATGVAIALGFAGLVLLGGYAVRIERLLRANTVYLQHTGHVAIYKQGGLERAAAQPKRYALSLADQTAIAEALRGDGRVEFFGRYLQGMGLAGNGCRTVPFLGLGVEPEVEARVLGHPEVQRATPELARPLRGRGVPEATELPNAAALSTGLAALLGKKLVYDDLPKEAQSSVPDCQSPEVHQQLAADSNIQLAGLAWSGGLGAIDAEVSAVFRTPLAETEDSALVTRLATLQSLFDTDAVTYVAVYLHRADDAEAVAADLQRQLQAAGLEFSVSHFRQEALAPYYVGTMKFLQSLVGFIAVLVMSVVTFSMLNSMTLTVLERTRELGTLRALGFTRRQVSSLMVREAVLLALGAVLLGLAIGLLVAQAVNAADVRFSPPGIPGSIRLLLTPTPALCLGLSLAMVPLAAGATFVAVRRRASARVVHLLTHSAT